MTEPRWRILAPHAQSVRQTRAVDFRAEVSRRLQQLNWSVLELSRRTGLHRDVLGRWLGGKRDIKSADLLRVLDAVRLVVVVMKWETLHAQVPRPDDRDQGSVGRPREPPPAR